MNGIEQIEENEWDEIADPECLAVVPFLTDELSEKYGIKFFEFYDDGLGLAKAAYIKINSILYFLIAHPEGTVKEAKYINVMVRSIEQNSEKALLNMLNALNLSRTELIWEQSNLGTGKWLLTRLDGNGNEVEMFRFLNEQSAQWLKKKYEEKGHKQSYFVKDAT